MGFSSVRSISRRELASVPLGEDVFSFVGIFLEASFATVVDLALREPVFTPPILRLLAVVAVTSGLSSSSEPKELRYSKSVKREVNGSNASSSSSSWLSRGLVAGADLLVADEALPRDCGLANILSSS